MLPEERYAAILELLKTNRIVSVHDLVRELDSSAPTIRRDLTVLHNKGLLQKVHGGATSIDIDFSTPVSELLQTPPANTAAKQSIALAASELVGDSGFIYIDASASTEMILRYLQYSRTTFVTNGIAHATYLASRHLNVILLGGTVKTRAQSIVGNIALAQLDSFNFSRGFFGTAGISFTAGFTTPDPYEADIKQKAMSKCEESFVLADPSKFNHVTPVTFANLNDATIITTRVPDETYKKVARIREVGR